MPISAVSISGRMISRASLSSQVVIDKSFREDFMPILCYFQAAPRDSLIEYAKLSYSRQRESAGHSTTSGQFLW